MPTEEIMNYIENSGLASDEAKKMAEKRDLTKSAKRKKNKKKKKSKKAAENLLKSIPLLKGFEINPSTPDSSADRMTSACTPHSKNERDGNIAIKDESEEKQQKVILMKSMQFIYRGLYLIYHQMRWRI